jgi:hypothetical protein
MFVMPVILRIAHTLKSYQAKGDLLRYQQVRQLYNDLMRPTQYPHPNSYSPTPGMVNRKQSYQLS